MEENQPTINPVSQKQNVGRFVALQRAKLMKDGITNNTAPFIPQNGETLSPEPIYNAKFGVPLEARTMIPAALLKSQNGFKSNVVASYYTSQEAKTAIVKDSKGVGNLYQGSDGEFHSSNYYFADQMEQPEKLQDFANKNMKWQKRLTNETLKAESPELSDYLASYLAAARGGAKLEVSPEVAEQFKANMLAVCENEMKPYQAMKDKSLPKLSDVFNEADKKSYSILKNREKELGIAQENKQERKPREQKRSKSQEIGM